MDEIIDGYPLYIYCCNMTFQFALFPLLCVFYNNTVFNTSFVSLMLKDYLVVSNNVLINCHHGLSILLTILFCNTQRLAIVVSVAEFGSGAYNSYILANHYDYNPEYVYWFYAITMTLSNIYCFLGVYNTPIYKVYKIPAYGLLVVRQYFLHSIS
jgi:hypothetical protein